MIGPSKCSSDEAPEQCVNEFRVTATVVEVNPISLYAYGSVRHLRWVLVPRRPEVVQPVYLIIL